MSESRPLALITGASSGIGATFARTLAARGYDLALVARRQDRLQQLADELSGKFHVNCTIMPADLTVDADLRRVEDFLAGSTNLQLLVNNAGFGTMGRFYEAPIETQDAMHRVHVMATMRLTHAALRQPDRAQPGRHHQRGLRQPASSPAPAAPATTPPRRG